jgi:hypothetical protein
MGDRSASRPKIRRKKKPTNRRIMAIHRYLRREASIQKEKGGVSLQSPTAQSERSLAFTVGTRLFATCESLNCTTCALEPIAFQPQLWIGFPIGVRAHPFDEIGARHAAAVGEIEFDVGGA